MDRLDSAAVRRPSRRGTHWSKSAPRKLAPAEGNADAVLVSPALPLTAGGACAPMLMQRLDDTAKVSGAPLAEPLGLRELIHHRAALAALQLQLPDGTLIRYAGLREFSPIAPFWRAGPEGTLTQQVTGSVCKPNPGTGFCETTQGERLQPGFKVAIS